MVNGDVPFTFYRDDTILLDQPLYEAQMQRIVGEIMREDADHPVRQSFRADDPRIQQRLNAYGQQRQDDLYKSLRARGDTQSEATDTFTTVNNAVAGHYVPQRTKVSCYAASLATAFSYLGMNGTHDDFVERRNGICPSMSTRSGSATYGEILAAIRSTVLGEQTAPFDWTLPTDLTAALRHSRYRQRLIGRVVQDEGSMTTWVAPSETLGAALAHELLPGVVPRTRMFQPPALPTMPQAQELRDRNGAQINLYKAWVWNRKNNTRLGGHAWPLGSTGDMISALLGGEAIMVGFGGKSAGHTVLVTGLKYKPRVEYSTNSVYYTDRSMILDIRVLDPLDVDRKEYWIGDVNKFFQEYRFGIAIADGIAL